MILDTVLSYRTSRGKQPQYVSVVYNLQPAKFTWERINNNAFSQVNTSTRILEINVSIPKLTVAWHCAVLTAANLHWRIYM